MTVVHIVHAGLLFDGNIHRPGVRYQRCRMFHARKRVVGRRPVCDQLLPSPSLCSPAIQRYEVRCRGRR